MGNHSLVLEKDIKKLFWPSLSWFKFSSWKSKFLKFWKWLL